MLTLIGEIDRTHKTSSGFEKILEAEMPDMYGFLPVVKGQNFLRLVMEFSQRRTRRRRV